MPSSPTQTNRASLAAMRKLHKRGVIGSGDRVVVISTAHGLKFVDFKLRYHEMRLADVVPEHANPPVELPAELGAVREALASL